MVQQMRFGPLFEKFRAMLPPSWSLAGLGDEPRGTGARPDGIVQITAPDGARARVVVESKLRLSAARAAELGPRLQDVTRRAGADGALVLTRFVSKLARERLRSAGVSYLDATGNAWIHLERPALLIDRQGAERDPDPPRRGVKSLKGAKAARLLRALCDWRPPVGVRQLALRAGTDPGYATRILKLLEDEDVVDRSARGEVVAVRWQDLLRRWAQDYSVNKTNRAEPYLAARGLREVRERLADFQGVYALTGSFAVPPEAQVVPAPVLSCYVDGVEAAAEELQLRPAEVGANVLLMDPFDSVVYERTRSAEGLALVAVSQCAVDLLTGPGREPAQGESLMDWMAENEDAWRV